MGQNLTDFFKKDNKSGWKTKEVKLKKNRPDIHDKIKDFSSKNNLEELPFKEQIWLFLNNQTQRPICKNPECDSQVKFKGTIEKGYSEFCSLECANESGETEKRKKQCLKEKYGHENLMGTEYFKEKTKETKKNKYGDENFNNIEKVKKTKEKKYGSDTYNNIEKVKETNKQKYGVENVFSSETVKEKSKNTNISKLGVRHPSKSNAVKSKKKDKYIKKLKQKFPFIINVHNNIFECRCEKCGNVYEIPRILLNERYREEYELCTKCNPIGQTSKSKHENELYDFIISLGVKVEQNNRELLNGKELDIYIPEHNIAIEFNGLYWHSEKMVDNYYHLNKTNECKEKDIELIHIFEDEWIYKPEIVKSIIKNKLNLTSNKIYGRKCSVHEITTKEAKKFCQQNHLQGYVGSSVKLGLFYGDELLSIMTFGKNRIGIGSKKDSYFELNRFCNKLNYNVVGGANKLFKYFVEKYNPNKVASYADKRYSEGRLYEKLGFDYIHDSEPNYFYVIKGHRKHRFNYRKDKLVKEGFNSNESEHEIMLNRGIYRIYDCGNMKFKFINK